MPLETASFLNQLVAANPAHDDGLGLTDAHIRLIKQALLATFPNLAAAVTASAADLNSSTATPGRLAALEGSAARLTGGNVLTGGQQINGSVNVSGTVNGAGLYQNGVLLVPRGVVVMWAYALNQIPAGWALCDGGNGTPDLRDRFIVGAGLGYGVGAAGGAALQSPTTSAAGSHSHTGVVAPAGAHQHAGYADQQGNHSHTGNTGGHTLTVDEIPPHTHGVQTHNGPGQSQSSAGDWATGSGYQTLTSGSTGSGWGHSHPIANDGLHTHNISIAFVGDHQHSIVADGQHSHTVSFDNRPPFIGLCFIMKL